MPLLKKMLCQLGIEEDRLRLDWVSASEGDRFVTVVNEMTETVRALGPLKLPPNGKFAAQAKGLAPPKELA